MGNQYIGNDLVELVKHLGKEQRNRWMVSCEGLITSVDPQTYMAKVMLEPWGVETGWLPIAAVGAGNGWGVFHLPPNNTEVIVDFVGGAVDNGRIRGCFHNASDAPPDGLQQGEFLLKHESGSMLHFDTDGNVNVLVSKDLTAIVQGDTNISALGDLTAAIQGDATITAQGEGTIAVQGDATIGAGGTMSITASESVTLSSVGGVNINGPATFTVPPGESMQMTIGGDANVNVTGSMSSIVEGDMSATVSGTASISGNTMSLTGSSISIEGGTVGLGSDTTIDGFSFRNHTHSGVTTGGGATGPVV